ncbi:MAG: hypothetical protein IPJ23_05910 [Ignavibacteriales bacterium]|nr:hypothetical protein [Ignavibacteriales bacterium]
MAEMKLKNNVHSGVDDLIIFAGLPAAITFAEMSFVTILPAPITEFAPIVTPLKLYIFTNQTFCSITIGLGLPLRGSSKCQSESVISVLAPQLTLFPIVMLVNAPITVPLKPQLSPIIICESGSNVLTMQVY